MIEYLAPEQLFMYQLDFILLAYKEKNDVKKGT